ncbi:hypothetical protein EJ08DRAFT_734554 [Tothia fuscella]|uniref:Uncharacterized protein n=1 Tax=Tothia fuscella TaxID=1048955 RepID=A0A9P4NQ82_9PEZI|nr:hypothetical protein EJ08DRAFT_734554 [Tothia fuscella]
MGGSQAPYIYNAPVHYGYSALNPPNEFNPKSVTQASQAPPPPPKPKQEGPLLNFNRHPDSYLVLPYGNTNAVPMSQKTKTTVKWMRHGQLGLRVFELLAAVGILICVICIRGTTDNEGWILRLPPGVDIAASVYAIYHLMRPAKGRTPASSASYHFFALFMDTGLIPFFVFTAMLGRANYILLPETTGRWRTVLSTKEATSNLLLATWLMSAVAAGLHVASFFFDIYLIMVFRKISQLPPDMNPLEDNLTSRRKNKHKYKNSSVTDITDKRMSEMTTSTTGTSNRMSQAQEPLIGTGRMSFWQSRNAEDGSFSPHNPTTARLSRVNLNDPVYQQSHSARGSRGDLNNQLDSPSRITSAMPSIPNISKRSSIVPSVPVYDNDANASPYGELAKQEGSNWAVLAHDSDSKPGDYDPYRTLSAAWPSRNNEAYHNSQEHAPLSAFQQQPLRMNPPTPEQEYNAKFRSVETDKENDRTQTMKSGVSTLSSSSTYSTNKTTISAMTNSTNAPKTRFYGDFAAAMRGVRQHDVVSPGPQSMVGSLHNAESEISRYSRASRPNTKRSPARAGDRRARPKSHVDSMSGTVIRKAPRAGEEEELHSYINSNSNSPRVISRSGVDVMNVGADLGVAQGRRDVSGKVAEEGRSDYKIGMFMRKASARS